MSKPRGAPPSAPRAVCLVLQHVGPEEPYAIAEALAREDVDLDVRRVFDGDAVPESPDGFAGIVVMGGPMSATSDDGFPTRAQEVALLARAVEERVPVLGVCLGAQLLAAALGGGVVAGAAGPEIGWGKVALTEAAGTDPLFGRLGEELDVLHWHGDTFELPIGATRLASSERYANQAFRAGDTAWGVQFHVEVDETAVERFLRHLGAEAAEQGADPSAVAAAAPEMLDRLAPVGRLVADRFASLVRARAAAGTSP